MIYIIEFINPIYTLRTGPVAMDKDLPLDDYPGMGDYLRGHGEWL